MADADRGPAVRVVTIVFLVLATIFVTLRMWSRVGIVKKVSADDYVMLLAWVCVHLSALHEYLANCL
jgi:hypothetical protein